MSLVGGAMGTASAGAELIEPGKGNSSAGISELAGGEAYGFGGQSLWRTPKGCWTSVGRSGSYFPGTRLTVRMPWCSLGSRLDEAGPESQGEEPETQLWAWAEPWLSAGGGSALGGRLFRPARSSASGAHYGMTKSRLWAPFPTPISSL